jgi:hypothetical protein
MNRLPAFPREVYVYVLTIFSEANRRTRKRYAVVSISAEKALDQPLVDVLADYGVPQLVAPGWAVRIDVHFLAGGTSTHGK